MNNAALLISGKRRTTRATMLLVLTSALMTGCASYSARHAENGDRQFNDKKYREAIVEYTKASRFQPDNPKTVRQLGLAHFHLGELNEALPFLEKAKELQPDDAEVRVTLGTLYLGQRRTDEAITEANAVVTREPKNSDALNLLGSAYLVKREPAKATEAYRRIKELTPNSWQPHYLVGVGLRAEGKSAEATTEFEAASSVSPAAIEPTSQLVEMDLVAKRYDAAVARVNRQISVVGDSARLYGLLGAIHSARGDAKAAEADLQRAISIQPSVASSHVQLAQLFLGTGRADEAMEQANQVLKTQPQNADALLIQALVYEGKGAIPDAERSYEMVLGLNPSQVLAANNLASLISNHGGDQTRAMQLATMAADAAPDDPHIADTLGWLLYKSGDYQKAVGVLRKSAAALPASAAIQYHFGLAAQKVGDLAGARSALGAAANASGNLPEKDAARAALSAMK